MLFLPHPPPQILYLNKKDHYLILPAGLLEDFQVVLEVVLEVVHNHPLLLHHFGGVEVTFSLSGLVDDHMVVHSHRWISLDQGYLLYSHP
jgi:hypothetical protein